MLIFVSIDFGIPCIVLICFLFHISYSLIIARFISRVSLSRITITTHLIWHPSPPPPHRSPKTRNLGHVHLLHYFTVYTLQYCVLCFRHVQFTVAIFVALCFSSISLYHCAVSDTPLPPLVLTSRTLHCIAEMPTNCSGNGTS